MSIATEIQRLQTAKENITIALLRAGYDIPSGITLDEYPPYIDQYFFEELTFNIISGGTIKWATSNTALTKTIEYKLNDNEWTSITSNIWSSAPSISVSAGDIVRFRGDNDGYATSTSIYTNFYSSAKFEVEGNIMSLIDSTGFTTATTLANSYTFYELFYNCTVLISAENLILPATTLANYCYSSMFYNCSSLTTAPELPATTLAPYCYGGMFYNCSSLTTAPELPATTLANNCYQYMFYGCTSLTIAPELPATTLVQSCYCAMFSNCTGLTTALELPATTLAQNCYQGMFSHCTSLTTAPELPATTLANNCYDGMFSHCTSLTTAPELPATTLAPYCYYQMFRNCLSLEIAPILPATTLVSQCYRLMFISCHNLKYIKCLATNVSSSNKNEFTEGWVQENASSSYGVASGGTFVKHPSATWWVGINGIPSGWTVENLPVEIYCDDFYFDFDNPDDSPLARECIDNHWTPEDWLNNYNNHNWPGVNMFELEDVNFIFNGKRYYLYKYEESGQIYYGLLSEERSRLPVLQQNSIKQDVDNYINNYYAFDYVLNYDMAMINYGGLSSDPGHFIVVWAE